MKYGLCLILCAVYFLQAGAQTTTQTRVCEYVYSDWSMCVNGTQHRSMVCVCDGKGTEDLTFCLEQNIVVASLTQPCSDKLVCKWRWTFWSACSASCGGGNVTRDEVCMCEGMKASSPDDYCDLSQRYGTEVAPCNTFACGKTPAHSKTYWMQKAEDGDWPIRDGVFNCSLSTPANVTSPKGKKYSKILMSKDDLGHPQWFFLAKEWIAVKLNIANGATFTEDILVLVNDVERLLEKCDGWTGNDFYLGVSAKEKLGRTNNNIGGLEHVDVQVSKIMNFDWSNQAKQNSNAALYVIVPCVAILVIGFIIGMTSYYIREKNHAVVDRGVFDSQEESSAEEPLKQKGDNLSPMVNLENEEKFDHSDSGSEHV